MCLQGTLASPLVLSVPAWRAAISAMSGTWVGAQQIRTRLLPAAEGCRLELGRGRGIRGPYQRSLYVCTSWGVFAGSSAVSKEA